MGFPRQDHGAGYHFLLEEILPTQGSNLNLLQLLALAGFFTTKPPGKLVQACGSITV